MAANSLRGEAELLVGDSTILLRPTFARLVAAEAELGRLFGLVERAAAGEARLSEIAGLMWHCAEPNGQERARFEEALFQGGVLPVLAVYRRLLAQFVNGT